MIDFLLMQASHLNWPTPGGHAANKPIVPPMTAVAGALASSLCYGPSVSPTRMWQYI